MAKARQEFWIPKLRKVVKKVRKQYYTCKRFQAAPFTKPKPATLPRDRTEGERQIAGPITYKVRKNGEGKAHILLITCSLSRAV